MEDVQMERRHEFFEQKEKHHFSVISKVSIDLITLPLRVGN